MHRLHRPATEALPETDWRARVIPAMYVQRGNVGWVAANSATRDLNKVRRDNVRYLLSKLDSEGKVPAFIGIDRSQLARAQQLLQAQHRKVYFNAWDGIALDQAVQDAKDIAESATHDPLLLELTLSHPNPDIRGVLRWEASPGRVAIRGLHELSELDMLRSIVDINDEARRSLRV